MKIRARVYPQGPNKKGEYIFMMSLFGTSVLGNTDEPVFDIVKTFKCNLNNACLVMTDELQEVINTTAMQFERVMRLHGAWDLVSKKNTTNSRKTISLGITLAKDKFKYSSGLLNVYNTTARDKIFGAIDYANRLDLETVDEAVGAVRQWLKRDNITEIKLSSLREYIQEFIAQNENKLSHNTIRGYQRLWNNILQFNVVNGCYDNMGELSKDQQSKFFNGYLQFLASKIATREPYENSTIKDDFKMLSRIKSHFEDTGIKVNLKSFVKDLRVGKVEMPYCTFDEVHMICQLRDNTQLTDIEKKVADLFLFQCFTGLRYGELKQVKEENIIYTGDHYTLAYVGDKTGEGNSVPLNDRCVTILDIWDKELPKVSVQKANQVLHLLLKRIPAFDRDESRVRFSGSNKIETVHKRYDLITTHSARHSYSHYLQSMGLTAGEVAQLMNHKSSATTDKHYKHIRHDDLEIRALEILNRKQTP